MNSCFVTCATKYTITLGHHQNINTAQRLLKSALIKMSSKEKNEIFSLCYIAFASYKVHLIIVCKMNCKMKLE